MTKHLAIFSEGAVKAIFSGSKTIECRFSRKRMAPFSQVHQGDIVYIKPSGKDVAGQFTVGKVISFEGIGPAELKMIRQYFGDEISLGGSELDEEFWNSHSLAMCGTLISIERVEQFIASPVKFKKSDRRAWVVLDPA